jgi:leader peptidase (prepilin peptidase) / N-methyltransferase
MVPVAAGGLLVGGCFAAGLACGPLMSWAALRARPSEGQPSRWLRFPLLAVSNGALFAALAVRFGASWSLLPELAMVAGLLPLAVIDATCLRLPTRLVYPTLAVVALGVAAATLAEGAWGRGAVAVGCSLGWAAVYLVVNRASPRLLGFGDVRLALVLGLGLGWLGAGYVVGAFLLANVLAVLGQAVMVGLGRRRWGAPLPLGAYLAGGAVVALLV